MINDTKPELSTEEASEMVKDILKQLKSKWAASNKSFKRPTKKRVEKLILDSHKILEDSKEEADVEERKT